MMRVAGEGFNISPRAGVGGGGGEEERKGDG